MPGHAGYLKEENVYLRNEMCPQRKGALGRRGEERRTMELVGYFYYSLCKGHLVQQWLTLRFIPGTNMHAGKVPCCVNGNAHPTRAQIQQTCSEAALCLHYPIPIRRIECRWNLLPLEQPRVVTPHSQWRRRYDSGTRVSSIRSKMASRIELGQAFGLKRGVNVF